MSEFEELAKQKAKEAWVERAQREKGNVELSTFEEKAERSAFERFWESNT